MAQPEERLPSEELSHVETQYELGTGAPAAVADAAENLTKTRVSSPARDAWRRFKKNYAALISLAIIIILGIAAALAPFMHTMSPLTQDYSNLDVGPSAHHWFGTDGVGRDQYSRLIW